MYYLNKIVGWGASPLGIALALVVLALVLVGLRRSRRLAAGVLVLAFAWLWFWGMPLTQRLVGLRLERAYLRAGRIPSEADFPSADAIVILGGGMDTAARLGGAGEMHAGADRVWRGARLWRVQVQRGCGVPRLIATGTECRASTAALLADFGVPTQSVTFVESARNTEEEARRVAALGVTNVLLVTSAWHMDRARLLFAKYAPAVRITPAPADFENAVFAARAVSASDFFPQAEAFRANAAVFRECVAVLGYRLFR